MSKHWVFGLTVLVFLLVLGSRFVYSQDALRKNPKHLQIATSVLQSSDNEEENHIEDCNKYKGLDYMYCVSKIQQKNSGFEEEEENLKDLFEKEIDKLVENIEKGIKKGRNFFVLNPSDSAIAGGKVLNIENGILELDTLGFLTKWDIKEAKGDTKNLNVGQYVKLLGRWDKENKVFKALHIKSFPSQPLFATSTSLSPQITEQIKNQLIEKILEILKHILQPSTSTNSNISQ